MKVILITLWLVYVVKIGDFGSVYRVYLWKIVIVDNESTGPYEVDLIYSCNLNWVISRIKNKHCFCKVLRYVYYFLFTICFYRESVQCILQKWLCNLICWQTCQCCKIHVINTCSHVFIFFTNVYRGSC